jgi:membrane protein implicated in regulation of membrane protease activity
VIRLCIGLFLLLQVVMPERASAQAAPFTVQMGFRVSRDTVIVGQPFDLFVKVLAPKGVRFEFPAGPDTTMKNGVRPIELRAAKVVSMLGDTAVALYHLVAWDIGVQPLRIPDVRVTFGKEERRPSLAAASVFVRSVLPADTALRVPKPPRPPIILPVFNWWPWIALVAAIIAAVLLWWAWRHYRNRPKAPVDPYVRAQRELERIEKLRLIEEGRAALYLALVVDVVREYLAARVQGVRRSDTTTELLRAMQPHDGVEAELPALLERADMVKFAKAEVSSDEARAVGVATREVIDHVEARLNPESEPAKRAARAAATKERAA